MYQYDKYDQAIVDARVEEFRDQVRVAWQAKSPKISSSRCA
jgi:hypothetical protein